jgi:hypothetical protein
MKKLMILSLILTACAAQPQKPKTAAQLQCEYEVSLNSESPYNSKLGDWMDMVVKQDIIDRLVERCMELRTMNIHIKD